MTTSTSSTPSSSTRFMQIHTLDYSIGVPPKYLGGNHNNNEIRCAEEFLESKAGKYEKELGGVILAHQDTQILSCGRCDVYSPDVIVRFRSKILCFAPPKGLILKNVIVVEVFRSHIGLLYEGTFPCKMTLTEIKREGLEWDSQRLCFISRRRTRRRGGGSSTTINDTNLQSSSIKDQEIMLIQKDSIVDFLVSEIVPWEDLFSVLGTIVVVGR
jgi:hypothetical protein